MVLTELAKRGERYVPVGVSARHVHLTQEDVERLFGSGHRLTPCKPLSQPGQFAAQERVTLIGPKGELGKVRILGPARAQTQIELALSDVLHLGLKNVPVRMSGKLDGTPGIRLIGPAGEIAPDHGVIVAARHIHMSDEQARAYGVHDGMIVSVRAGGVRPCVLENVVCRTGSAHELELHLDTDEANACALATGDYVELLPSGGASACHCGGSCGSSCDCGKHEAREKREEPPRELLDLVTERDVDAAAQAGRRSVYCERTALITPAAADRAAELGLRILRADPAPSPAAPTPEAEEVLELVTETDLNAAFLAGRKAVYCLARAPVTDAARDRAAAAGIRIIRV